MKTVIILFLATSLTVVLGYAWVLHTRAGAFWSRTVSFSCSYVPPAFDHIIYTRMEYRSGFYQIVMQARPSGPVAVLTPTEVTAMHGLSNGNEIIYDRLIGNQFDILQGPLNGTRKALENTSQLGKLGTTITPDGNFVPFMTNDTILIYDLRTRKNQAFGLLPVVTINPGLSREPVWEAAISPNLKEVAVVAYRSGRYIVGIYPRGGTSVGHILHSSDHIIMRVKWLPDGSGVTFVEQFENGWAVVEAKTSNGARRVIFSNRSFIESAELHPDRARLLLTLGEDQEWRGYFSGLHVYEIDLGSGNTTRVGY